MAWHVPRLPCHTSCHVQLSRSVAQGPFVAEPTRLTVERVVLQRLFQISTRSELDPWCAGLAGTPAAGNSGGKQTTITSHFFKASSFPAGGALALRPSSGPGMVNHGNTCYLNSVLQVGTIPVAGRDSASGSRGCSRAVRACLVKSVTRTMSRTIWVMLGWMTAVAALVSCGDVARWV